MKKIGLSILSAIVLIACSSDDSPSTQVTLPVANFSTTTTTITVGSSVTFANTSLNASSYQWLFPGGDPNTSTEESPTVTYNTAGVFSVTLTAVNATGDDNTITLSQYITVEEATDPTMATYNVTFVGNWSAFNHPTDFPSGDHFTTAIGMQHQQGAKFFEEGELASAGMEIMAETGGTDELSAEIDAIVNSGMASVTILGEGLLSGFSEITFQITVTNDFPLVTLVSMIAPSPDWFIAVENVSLLQNGAFVENLTVDAIAYDSGTDDGTTFDSSNSDTDPAETITEITDAPLGNGTNVTPPMAMFTFFKVDN
ncbi:spondin domain-containing protein [Muriicola sp. Z0-33]|uniref:spondin domain-containing protein n=1 Tax=Muriicola sp. Z0-33 TaxID=2816957 RepID=UPI002238D41C|nr:spondin domain-containing protein [Muriicola sp. Z0-33]MCW5517282.1 spondin domain-containing protein [Muriicola sp. Z0-33]